MKPAKLLFRAHIFMLPGEREREKEREGGRQAGRENKKNMISLLLALMC